ncbi:MAG: pilus assembly protein PilM [bacterium]
MIGLSKKAIGLNISDTTIELVALIKRGTQPKIVSLARTALIPGIVEEGRIKDAKKLAVLINQLAVKAQPQPISLHKINFTLPESRVYCHVFNIEAYDKDDKIDDLVWQETIKNIPLPEDEIIFSYKIIHVFKRKAVVLLVATNRQVLSDWQEFFKTSLKIEVEEFDVETLANFRGLFTKRPLRPVCLVDIGASSTNIGIFDKRGLRYVHTSDWAGDKLTSRLAKVLNTTKEDAEKKKIRYGMLTHNNEMHTVLARGVNAIFKEIMEAMRYYHQKTHKKIHKVILLGGSSHMKGLTEYLQTNLNLPVSIGASSLLKDSVPLEYITAIGAAWRDLDRKWEKTDPLLEFSFSQKAKEERQKKKQAEEVAKSAKAAEKKGGKKDKNKPKVVDSSATLDLDLDVDQAEMEGDDFDLGEDNVGQSVKKLKMQKILLVVIFFLGIGGVFLAFNFRSKEKAAKEAAIGVQEMAVLNKPQTLSVKAVIAGREDIYQSAYISGRVVNDVIQTDGSYEEALTHSKNNIQKSIAEGEKYWPEPLSGTEVKDNVQFPLTFVWMIYSEKEANLLLLAEVDKLNINKVDYSLVNMEKKRIIPIADKPNHYYLEAEISIMTSELLPIAAGADVVTTDTTDATAEEEAITAETTTNNTGTLVVISDTGTGFLNVRQGPGTSYDLVGKVTPGDRLPFLEESNGWYKITLTDGQIGWVVATYAQKVTE